MTRRELIELGQQALREHVVSYSARGKRCSACGELPYAPDDYTLHMAEVVIDAITEHGLVITEPKNVR